MHPADIRMRVHGGTPPPWLKRTGGPANRRLRIVTALARSYVMKTDRRVYDKNMLVPARSIAHFMDPVEHPDRNWWTFHYTSHYPFCETPVREVRRKEVLKRISEGKLGIEAELGVWSGSFWHGLRLSGATRPGPGTEIRIWQPLHKELLADIAAMPLMHRLEPMASKSGQRRLRRCYVAFLPPEDPMGPSALAGLFSGAILRDVGGEFWMVLPDRDAVRAILNDWGMPFQSLEHPKGMRVIHVSPFFGALVAHLMPPNSAKRVLAIRRAGGCPLLPAVLWEMTMARKHARYMPSGALPFGVSKATAFRKGWRRRDLHKAGWCDLGIRITPTLRGLLQDWYERRLRERAPAPPTGLSNPFH